MRITRLPIAMLSMATVFSMATMGVSYTLWADKLEINGTVKTGIVDTRLSVVATEVAEFEGKDVGKCTAVTLSGAAQGVLGGGNKPQTPGGPVGADIDTGDDKVEISITNGYPFYACDVKVTVTNYGTIPVKLQPLALADLVNAGNVVGVTITENNCWAGGFQIEPVNAAAIGVTPVTPTSADCTLHFEIQQAADENATYSFVKQFEAHQWNEYTP